MDKISKHEKIEQHLINHGSISGREALVIYGVYRLSSVINRLRKKHTIRTELVGDERYARYVFVC